MDLTEWLIVGLGNPGRNYKNTWHSIGFEVVNILSERWKVPFKAGKGDFYYCQNTLDNQKVTLMMPLTYMNLSGSVVLHWVKYFKVDFANILVVYDDNDLPLGRIRLRERGTDGGHRGMADIIRRLGVDDIPRLRIGINYGSCKKELSYRVLSKIPRSLTDRVDSILMTAADAVEMVLQQGVVAAMNKYNAIEIE